MLVERPKSAKNATKQAVRTLKEYCDERALSTEFQNVDRPRRLPKHLYANQRKIV